jgi:hypothetical protein
MHYVGIRGGVTAILLQTPFLWSDKLAIAPICCVVNVDEDLTEIAGHN